jgi:hypothetical protein
VDKILDGKDIILLIFTKKTLSDAVVRDRDSLLGNFAIPTIVDEFPDRFQVRLPTTTRK